MFLALEYNNMNSLQLTLERSQEYSSLYQSILSLNSWLSYVYALNKNERLSETALCDDRVIGVLSYEDFKVLYV